MCNPAVCSGGSAQIAQLNCPRSCALCYIAARLPADPPAATLASIRVHVRGGVRARPRLLRAGRRVHLDAHARQAAPVHDRAVPRRAGRPRARVAGRGDHPARRADRVRRRPRSSRCASTSTSCTQPTRRRTRSGCTTTRPRCATSRWCATTRSPTCRGGCRSPLPCWTIAATASPSAPWPDAATPASTRSRSPQERASTSSRPRNFRPSRQRYRSAERAADQGVL